MGDPTTSGKTFADLILAARYTVNDRETPYFADDTEMLEWADEGHRQAVLDSACLQDVERIDLITDTLEYDVTAVYHRIHAVLYVDANNNQKALAKGTPARVGHAYDVTEPVEYYEFEGRIGVYPVLTAQTTEYVNLYLSKRAATSVTLATAVETPSMLDNGLIWYIVAMWEQKRKKYAASAQAMAKFEKEVYKARTEFYPGFAE